MCYIAYANWIGKHRWGLCGHREIDAIRRRAAAGSPADYLPDDPREADAAPPICSQPLRWDVALARSCCLIVSASFMLAGAAVLYPRLAAANSVRCSKAGACSPSRADLGEHPSGLGVGVLRLRAGRAVGHVAVVSGNLRPRDARIPHCHLAANGRFHFGGCSLQFAFTCCSPRLALVWIDVNFATLTAIVSFLATNAGVAVAMLAALYLNFQLPPLYRTRWWMLAAGIVSAVILVAVSAISGWELTAQYHAARIVVTRFTPRQSASRRRRRAFAGADVAGAAAAYSSAAGRSGVARCRFATLQTAF